MIKNKYETIDNVIYGTCPGGKQFAFDPEMYDVVSAHRWRYVGDQIVTIVEDNNLRYAKLPLQNLILGYNRLETVRFKNNDTTDCRKCNLFTAHKNANEVYRRAGIGFLRIAKKRVKIDAEDMDLVRKYHWNVFYSQKQRPQIRTNIPLGNKKFKTVLLHRMIAQVDHQSNITVDFKNGNVFDCRKENLIIGKANVNNKG